MREKSTIIAVEDFVESSNTEELNLEDLKHIPNVSNAHINYHRNISDVGIDIQFQDLLNHTIDKKIYLQINS